VAAVEEICRTAKEEGHRYKTVVVSINHKPLLKTLEAERDIFLEAGFQQVGQMKEVIDKGGALLDKVTLQKML
jgi:L-amino acid N-acyltransferase YncA